MTKKTELPVSVGIDVNCARRARLPICFISTARQTVIHEIPKDFANSIPRSAGNGEIRQATPFCATAREVAAAIALIAHAQKWSILSIAIDAPAAAPTSGTRTCEAELGVAGLSSFRTPSASAWRDIKRVCEDHLNRGQPLSRLPFANKVWMLFGFELFSAFRERFDADIIEVYPYAIANTLVSCCPHKSTEDGYRLQLNAMAARTGWEPQALHDRLKVAVPGRQHDRLDAYMSAWVGSLPIERRCAYGVARDMDDAIWVPVD